MIEETTEQAPYVYTLSTGEYAATVEKIEKINDRAEKRGFTGRLEVVGVPREKKSTHPLTGIETVETVVDTQITGKAPSYAGFTFLARIDRVGDTFTIATAPGVDHVDRALVHAGECDHCGFNRRRNNTYLVRNDETGETVNVGSTCIKDFLGWDASVVFFTQADLSEDLDSLNFGGGYYERHFTVDTVLATAVAATKAHGWVPASSYDDMPTKSVVSLALMPPMKLHPREKALLEAMAAFADEAVAHAANVKAYILSDDFAGQSTYVENLKVLAAADVVTSKHFGLLASAPQAYARHLGQVAERKAQASKSEGSEWVGQVGDKKVLVEGTIEQVRYFHGDYGTTTIYKILSKEGNLFTWFSSNGALGDDEGVEVKITGTIKKHEEFKGTKTTVLTRCKVLS